MVDLEAQLFRARELFIDLFQDTKPLMELGYTYPQIEFAIPSIKLIGEEGEVLFARKEQVPYLFFPLGNCDYVKSAQIDLVRNKRGCRLTAWRDETARNDREVLKMLIRGEPVQIPRRTPVDFFSAASDEVANIAIFNDSDPVDNLDYIVSELYYDPEFYGNAGTKKEGFATKVAERLGICGTYQASWTDDRKIEFMAIINRPDPFSKPDYVSYKRLRPISDSTGIMIPFGQKPNISKEKVQKVLESKKRVVVTGNYALGRTNI